MGVLDQIKEIEDEMARTQKNKATNGHLGKLKARVAKLRSELLLEGSAGKGGGDEGFSVGRTGDGRVALIGFPSVGKSSLLSELTETESLAAGYEFTTLTCIPGNIIYNGTKIQVRFALRFAFVRGPAAGDAARARARPLEAPSSAAGARRRSPSRGAAGGVARGRRSRLLSTLWLPPAALLRAAAWRSPLRRCRLAAPSAPRPVGVATAPPRGVYRRRGRSCSICRGSSRARRAGAGAARR